MLFAPLITPFNADQLIDFNALESNISLYEETSLTGFLVNGSSAESEMLTLTEREQALDLVLKMTRRPVIAGVVAHSTHDALQQLEVLRGKRIKAALVRTPSYFGKQLDQVCFFSELAQKSPVPLMLYQIPQYTGIRLTGQELWEISQHPNIIGIKDSLGDLALLNEYDWPEHFDYYLGASALLQPGLAAGATGGILALANVVPDLCFRLLQLSADPDQLSEARRLQQRLIPLNRLLGGSRGYGIAGLKAACELRGYKAGLPRRPIRAITKEQKKHLQEVLEELLVPVT